MYFPTAFARAHSTSCKYLSLALCCLYTIEAAEPLEQSIAAKFSTQYQQNEQRLKSINEQLQGLPISFPREPTGTGGFLSDKKSQTDNEVILTFRWNNLEKIDAVALFPLRLFMDEVYGENLYWPKKIKIETKIDGSTTTLAELNGTQTELRQSLPEFVKLDAVTTDNLVIRCTGLQRHPNEDWYAAGFAEIFIFSKHKNLGPLAKLETNGSRSGKYILSSLFLTDDQTPLGIPQQTITTAEDVNFFRKIFRDPKPLETNPLKLTLHYAKPVTIDAIRIDTANRYYYGQGFPRRFKVEIRDENGTVLHRYRRYSRFRLSNPALNPFFINLPETKASVIQITVLETHQRVGSVMPSFELSEITPLHRGLALGLADSIALNFGEELRTFTRETDEGSASTRPLASLNDGYIENGRIISQREWAEGLHLRQQLMEEQIQLQGTQKVTLSTIHLGIVSGSFGLVIIIIGTAIFFVVRSRIKAQQHILLARAQIASDLHDDVGSNLGTIIIRAEQMQKQNYIPSEHERLQQILQLTKESVLGLQEVLQTTSPEIGHHKSLTTHLQELTALMLGQTPFTFDIDPIANDVLNENVTRGKFMLFYKEALHNAKKHAQCTHVDVSIKRSARALTLSIADDGIGIDTQALAKARTLRTLKKRAEWLGGQLQIDSTPEQGTRLTLELPFTAMKRYKS